MRGGRVHGRIWRVLWLAVPLLVSACVAPAEYVERAEVRVATDPVLDAALAERAAAVAAAIVAEPRWPDGLFDGVFRANVPDASIRRLFADTHRSEGAVRSLRAVRRDAPRAARYELEFERGGALQLDLRLDETPPYAIRYLWIYRSVPGHASLAAAAESMSALAGRVSFVVHELSSSDAVPRELAALNPETSLDIASGFKLYVLGALVDDIAAGRRAWTDTIQLDARLRSIPTGLIHRWPDGSPVTLHTLASLMIDQSDNTATDHLIALLGRERIESMAVTMGHRHADLNVPLLTTGDMFRLKYADGGHHADAYLGLSVDGRRDYLATELGGIPVSRIDTPSGRDPKRIDTIGWFASAGDLCRAMDWLRRAAGSDPHAPLLRVLAIEPGTSEPRDIFPYQGYKGGRLPGIVSGAWLVRRADGAWFAVSAVWNDPAADPDEAKLRSTITRVLQLVARTE
ncbi:MAG: class A beta-lactamase-related serine hydrolase [Planctomycetes bacterium]|nr:class A beta-lactamase-related serine hydrolase [Planctomycetota bacterium]